MSGSVFEREGLGWRYEPEGRGVTLRAHHLKWSGGELWGVVEVTAKRDDLPSFLTRQRVNMTGGTGRMAFTKQLAERAGNAQGFASSDWLAILESLFVRVGDAEGRGPDLEWVGDEEMDDGVPHVIERIVEKSAINVIFGPGDQGKSWIALYLRICVQLGVKPFDTLDVRQCETLAVDYEAPAETYNRRLRAVLRGMNQPFKKMRLWRPIEALPRQIEALARIVTTEQIGFYTVDSAGHAAGSPGEHGTWEDAALALGKSLKVHFPATALVIDHTTGEGSREKLAGRAGGAYRKYTDSRVQWECRKTQEAGNEWSLVGLYSTKGNNTIKWTPIGVRISFESDVWGRATVVRFERDDDALRDDAEHAQRGALRDRIRASLEGDMTVYELSKLTGDPPDSVAAKLREMRKRGETRTVEGGFGGRGKTVKWRLTETRIPNALNTESIRSGFGEAAPASPNPTTRIDENPNSRVNGTDDQRRAWAASLPYKDNDGEAF